MIAKPFADRHTAGAALAARLRHLAGPDTVVLGLARGGVPVAYEVARALGARLDVLVVRKIGAPGNPEYGIGALAEDGTLVLDERSVAECCVSHEELEAQIARARAEISARVARYRAGRPPLDLGGASVIVVDDGLATGGTARAALRAARSQGPRRLVLAVPVGAPQTVAALAAEADEVVCVLEPRSLFAVGSWYEDFAPTSDSEIAELLDGRRPSSRRAAPDARRVRIAAGAGVVLTGDLVVPAGARGLVVFAHGSGSSRHSPRNRRVAAALNERGLATLLLDLLTMREERDRANVFDIPLLASRLGFATRWAGEDAQTRALPVAYFGASTGAGAALWAAADPSAEIAAVVSRGGRPDLAAQRLHGVRAAVLLIVGARDEVVLELNRQARRALRCESELAIVDGATHLFEEPGALERVAELAAAWFERHLAASPLEGRRVG